MTLTFSRAHNHVSEHAAEQKAVSSCFSVLHGVLLTEIDQELFRSSAELPVLELPLACLYAYDHKASKI